MKKNDIYRYFDIPQQPNFGQTFLGFISCICWINDVNSLIDFSPSSPHQGGIRVNLTPKMRKSLLNITPTSQMMPNFTFPLHKYDSKKSSNQQQVLLRLAPTLVKVNNLTPLRQEFANSAPKIFGVEYTDSTLAHTSHSI